MITRFPQRLASRYLAILFALALALAALAGLRASASSGAGSKPLSPATNLVGVFYTVTGTADNTDATVHGGTGSSADPFQMSSLRGAVLNGNTVNTSASGPVTIMVPAGTYNLTTDNPNTPGTTGTINFPDIEAGSGTNADTTIIGTGGVAHVHQTVADNDVITTGFDGSFTPAVVKLRLENLEISGGGFSGVFTGFDTGSARSDTTIVNCNIHDNSNPFGQGGGMFNQTGNLTVQGTTFSNNSAAFQGGAIFYDLPNSNGSPGTFGNFTIQNSTFNNNTASVSGNVAGGAIAIFVPNRAENTYSISGSTFTNNHAPGGGASGGAIGSGGAGSLSVNLSRFNANTASAGTAINNQGGASIDATNNWWGCDNSPGSAGCDTVLGPVLSSPRLDLVVTSTPGCNSTTVTADFSKNSSGVSVSPTVLNGLTVTFAVISGPSGAAVSPTSAVISGFTASTSLTATAGGTATVSATLDQGTQNGSAEIDKAVAVTSSPSSMSVCDGGTAAFTATASGNPAPTVQWQVSTNGGGSFSDIGGATSATLTFTATSAQNGNQYRAVFTNSCNSTTNTATTSAATLTVNTAPTVSTNPVDQTGCEGATATFTAAAGGSASTVQWQVSTNGGGSFSDVPGATNATLSFTITAGQNGNKYRAVFTNSCGSATTTAATLTVNANTTASTPANQTVCQGATANFSTTAGGTGPFTYAWTVDGSPSGGNTSSLAVSTGSLSVGNHSVSVTVSGACGSDSKSATLTVQENTATSDPADQTVCEGASASFSTTATGTGPFHYAWTLDGSPTGGDTSSIAVSGTPGNHAVSVTTTGACGSASQSATLTVQANTATSDPADQTVCQSAPASFSTTASGTGPFTYAWTVDGSPAGSTSSITVATGSLSVGNHTVSVTTTGACGSASQSATLTVNANTTATTPGNQTVCPGTNANFSTTAGGTGPFTYAWTVDGSPAGTTSSISVSTGSLSTGNHAVSVTVSGSCGSATKNATLTVLQNTATSDPADQSVCLGGTASFSTTATGTGPFSFVWKQGATVLTNGSLGGRVSIVSGASGSTLTITNVQAGDFGTYSVATTGSCNTATQTASLSVNSTPPGITLNGANISFWPPNHSYHTVAVTDLVSGASSCDGTVNLNSVIIDHVTSDEAENGNGDGNTNNDIVIACNRKSVELRSERDGSGDGRVYTIYFKVTDGLGHSTTVTAKVTVPKNQNGSAAVDSGPHYTVSSATCP